MSYALKTAYTELFSDTLTPISLYLKVRDLYANSLFFETTTATNTYSFVGLKPIAHLCLNEGEKDFEMKFPDGKKITSAIENASINTRNTLTENLKLFLEHFELIGTPKDHLTENRLLGYCKSDPKNPEIITEAYFTIYEYLIIMDHNHNQTYIYGQSFNDSQENLQQKIHQLSESVTYQSIPIYNFSNKALHRTTTNTSTTTKYHFRGDEFNVLRKLRSKFGTRECCFLDYGNYKLFGSSTYDQKKAENKTTTLVGSFNSQAKAHCSNTFNVIKSKNHYLDFSDILNKTSEFNTKENIENLLNTIK